LFASLIALLVAVWRLLRGCFRRGRPLERPPTQAATVPAWAFRQPDPLIYSQEWLLGQGLAVTWQNPDIHLEALDAAGVAVDSSSLEPDTVYRIVANVWNGSPDAPVAYLPVEMSFLDFGIGGVTVPIGTTFVALPVKGAPGTPARASLDWRTPETPGHYCLQVRLVWADDANPHNNMGQHNVDVKPLNSPRAVFTVPVRNPGRFPIEVQFRTDGYEIPEPAPCNRPRRTVADHSADRHPISEGWAIDLGEATQGMRLKAAEAKELTVTLVAPEGFTGRQAVNLNGLAGGHLLGGVTLIAEGRS
jgi:hypothetical protein